MLNKLMIKVNQFLEEAREKSLRQALKKSFSKYIIFNRIIVPVYHELSGLKQLAKTESESTSSLEFLVVNGSNVDLVASMHDSVSRKLKGISNTRSGYHSYAAVLKGKIMGDIWCATTRSVKTGPIHPDLAMLGIKCGENEAYMFDLYVTPDPRGKMVTNYLLGGALNHLKEDGFEKVYGYYDRDNLPALWTHRLFGYNELGKRRLFRFLFLQKSRSLR